MSATRKFETYSHHRPFEAAKTKPNMLPNAQLQNLLIAVFHWLNWLTRCGSTLHTRGQTQYLGYLQQQTSPFGANPSSHVLNVMYLDIITGQKNSKPEQSAYFLEECGTRSNGNLNERYCGDEWCERPQN